MNQPLNHFDVGACNEASRFSRDEDGGINFRLCLNFVEDNLEVGHDFFVQRVDLRVRSVKLNDRHPIVHRVGRVLPVQRRRRGQRPPPQTLTKKHTNVFNYQVKN